MAEGKGTLEILSDIGSVLGAIKGAVVTIIYLPQTLSKWIGDAVASIMPAFLQWEIGRTAALILGIAAAALWIRHWAKVTGAISKVVGVVPFIGGFLSLIINVIMWLGLYQGCRAFAGTGWIQALALFILSAAINAPGIAKWMLVVLRGGKDVGKAALVKGGKVALAGGQLAMSSIKAIKDKDPVALATWEEMKNLLRECTTDDIVDDTRLLALANHQTRLLTDELPDKASMIESVISGFIATNGIMVLKTRPITQALAHEMNLGALAA